MLREASDAARLADLTQRWADWTETMAGIDQALPGLWEDFRRLQRASMRLPMLDCLASGTPTARLLRKIALEESLLRDGR